MTKFRIGIDPDLQKSGYAFLMDKEQRLDVVEVTTLGFWKLIETIERDIFDVKKCNFSAVVYLEAGWLNKKSNFHYSKTKDIAGRIGKNVGENHAVGKLIEEFLITNNIPYKLVKPTSSKWDAKLYKQITGDVSRTNQEERDAVKAAWY